MLTWKRRLTANGTEYAGYAQAGVLFVARVTRFTLDGKTLWAAAIRIESEGRIEVTAQPSDKAGYYGAWRTAKAAMAAAEGRYAAEMRAKAEREAANNYAEARKAGNAEGRAYFRNVQAGSYQRAEASGLHSLAEIARRASAAACGAFADGRKRAAFERAFCAGYRDSEFMAEQAAKPAEIVRPEFEEESSVDPVRRDVRNARNVIRGKVRESSNSTLAAWLRGLRNHRAMYHGALCGSALEALFTIAAIRVEMRRRAESV